MGREISWPNMQGKPIEQEWFSAVDQRTWTFSGFAYAFISFDLVLDGWLSDTPERLQPFECDFLHELPRLRQLLNECEIAANIDENERVLPLIIQAREFLDAFEKSIVARVGPTHLNHNTRHIDSLWGAGRCH